MKILSFSAVRLCLLTILFLSPFEVWGASIRFTNGVGPNANKYNVAGNWDSGTVPGAGDTAIFDTNWSPQPITISGAGPLQVAQFQLQTGGRQNTFDFSLDFEFLVLGINNLESASPPAPVLRSSAGGSLTFSSASSSANSTIVINAGTVTFNDTSTAGTSNITNNGGTLTFNSTTSSAGATVVNNVGSQVNISAATELGSLSEAGGVALNNDLTVGALNQNNTISGVITGGVGNTLTKTGTGTLTLSGVNTYSGGTTLTDGTLAVTNSDSIGTGNLTFNGAATTLLIGTDINNNIILNSTGTVDTTTGNTTFNGSISGAGNFVKTGPNVLKFGATPNTYAGTTTVNNGTFNANVLGALPNTTAVTVTSPGILQLNTNQTITSLTGNGEVQLGNRTLTTGTATSTYSGVMSGAGGSLIKAGGGTFTLSGANTYTGLTTINAGTLTFTGSTTGLGGNIDNATALIFDQAAASSFTHVISGAGTVTKSSAGNLTLSGANTYAGATSINAGTLTFTGNTTGLGGNIDNATALVFNQAADSSFTHVISGAGTVTKDGAGNLTLSGANTYAGATTVNAGTLTFTGNTTGLGGNIANATALVFNQAADSSFTHVISGAGTVTKDGAGILTLSGANTYTGATTVNNGTLQGTVPAATALTVTAPGIFNLTASQTIGSLTGSGNVTLGANTLTTGNGADTTYSGVISGTGGLTKIGTGKFTITTLPTYTGLTTITAGTLAGLLPMAAPLTINGGGTYDLNGGNRTIGSLSGSGFVTLGASTLTFGNNNSTSYSGTISGTGGMTKTGTGDFTFSGLGGVYTGLTTVNNGSFTLTGPLSGPVTVDVGGVFNVAGTTLSASNPVTNNGITNFTSSAAADNATIANNGGATVDISGISGPSLSVGSLSGAGNIILGAKTLIIGGLNTALDTISGVISGAGGGLTKTGTGTVAITAVPTYTGPTTINDGILEGFLPATTVLTVNSPGRYDLTANQTTAALIGSGDIHLNAFNLTTGGNNASTTYSGIMSGTGGLIKDGLGILTLLGANTFTGGITINGGDVQVGGGGIPDNETVTLGPGAELTLLANETIGALQGLGSVELGTFTLTTGGNNLSTNFGGVAFGTGGIVKQGSGVFTLAGANTYTGMTTINSGTLALTGSLSGPVTVNVGSFFNVAGATLLASNPVTNNGTTNFTGAAAADNATITNNGGATVDITGINGPSLSVGSLSGAGNVILGAQNLILGGLNISDTISGIISGVGGSLTKIGTDVLTLATAPTYTGATTVSGGTLLGFLPSTTALTVNGGATYGLNGSPQTIGSLAGVGNVNLGAFTLTTGGDNSSTLFSGVLSGTGGLTKGGAGTLTLAGANTFTGLTTIDSGALTLTGSLSGPVTVDAGSFFNVAGATLSAANLVTNNGTTNFTGAAAADNATIANNGGATVDISGISGSSLSVGSLSGAGNVILGTKNLILGGLNISDTISGIISGVGGSLTKIGTGPLTLSGANTYTGGTTINAGILAVAADGNLGGAAGGLTFDGGTLQTLGSFASTRGVTLNAGGGTIDTNSFNLTLSGNIVGNGAFIKTGTGTLTLSGINSYTGATTVNNGTLQGTVSSVSALTVSSPGIFNLTSSQTIGSLAGTGGITLNGFNLTAGGNNSNTTYSGVMSGTGGLIKTGTGNLTLLGANTYTGGTTITGGILTGNTTSLIGNIVNNAALVFDQAVAGTFAGIVSGTGALTKTGAGTLTLSGANTYTGPTTVSNGILQGTIPSVSALTVSSPGIFNLTSSQTIGSLAGTGGVTLNDFNLTTGGNNSNTTYSGVMSGTGGFIKTGTGIFTFSGNNTYTGQTTIAGGTLINNGTLLSPVFVSPGTTYGGNGISGNLINDGVVSPGNSIGTLSVSGFYLQEPGGALDIEITPAGLTDLLQITGTAALDGTLTILPLGSVSSFVHRTYTFLTAAGGVSGQFATVTPVAGLQFTINYLSNAVQLIVQGSNFSSLVTSGNAGIIASYLDQIVANGTASPDLNIVLSALSNAAAQGTAALTAALNQISPDPYRELGFLSFEQTNLLRQSVSTQQQRLISTYVLKTLDVDDIASESLASFQNHLQGRNFKSGFQPMNFNVKAPRRPKIAKDRIAALSFNESSAPVRKMVQIGKSNIWIEPAGEYQRKKNSSPLVGTKSHTYGTTGGADTLVAPNTYVGVLGGIMNTHFDWLQHRGKGSINGYFGGLYALWLSKTGFYLDGQATLGVERYKARRNINFQTINRTARSKHNGVTVATDLEAGYLWTLGKTLIQPFFNFAYVAAQEGSFNEKGANSLNAHLSSKTSQFSRSELGPILSYFFTTCDETIIYPSAKLSWVQKRPWGNKGKKDKFNFTDQNFKTTVYGDNRVRNMISPGLSLTAQFKNGLYVTGDVNAEAGSGERLGQVMLNLGYNF